MASTAANRLNFLDFLGAQSAALLALTVMVFASVTASPAAARGAPDGFADLAERLSPAVVNISTTQEVQTLGNLSGALAPLQKKFGSRQASSLGSGFIIDPRGIVVTNNHVIQNAVEIKVNLSDGREFKAKVRGVDQETGRRCSQSQALQDRS
ncbi:MAG: trypsin-like peptidase domain-containing protein, partial [Pseudomonadota bacterium]